MHFMRFLTIISDFELKKNFFDFLGPMTRFHQKCLSQDIVQAGSLILFLVYFYDSYLQHIKSCQGKVDFEMNLRISLVFLIRVSRKARIVRNLTFVDTTSLQIVFIF